MRSRRAARVLNASSSAGGALQYTERLPEIDVTRGIAIVFMVFFSLNGILSPQLPEVLSHNHREHLHLGDFVLPLFVFTSGMSLEVFAARWRARGARVGELLRKLVLLLAVGTLLSPFTSLRLFGMDEIMLNAVLFVPVVLLAGMSQGWLLVATVAPLLIYPVLSELGALPDFSAAYLGGYPAAPFYLPVMALGALAVRRRDAQRAFALLLLAVALVSCFLIAPRKLEVTPSFMLLAAALSLVLVSVCRNFRSPALEYLGRNPLRYWVLLFVVFVIPIRLFTPNSEGPQLHWIPGNILAVAALAVLYLASRGLDVSRSRATQRMADWAANLAPQPSRGSDPSWTSGGLEPSLSPGIAQPLASIVTPTDLAAQQRSPGAHEA